MTDIIILILVVGVVLSAYGLDILVALRKKNTDAAIINNSRKPGDNEKN